MRVFTSVHAVPSPPRQLSITRVFDDGIELNWLPPTEPNGEVRYVIYYTPEGGTEQSIDTGSNLTHYNLTGLERNRMYTNIAVQAVNSAGRSNRSAVIAQYNHIPPGESSYKYLCTFNTACRKKETFVVSHSFYALLTDATSAPTSSSSDAGNDAAAAATCTVTFVCSALSKRFTKAGQI